MMVPDLFIVGATKCATSSLHYQLGQSGYISASHPKEPRFLEDGLSIETAKRKYRDVFGNRDFRVEANPNHFVIGYAPQKIKLINPKAKIIIMIREPVARYTSHLNYFMKMRPGREVLDFTNDELDLDKFNYEEDYVPYMCPEWGNYKRMYAETGCYAYYIPRFTKLFDTRVIIFEDYIQNPHLEVARIMQWLDLPNSVIHDDRIRNRGRSTWKPDDDTRKNLERFYEPYNDMLFTIVGRELWKY